VADQQDSGVGVRKRVIKLLVGIFGSVTDPAIHSDICCRFIEAMGDHDDAVKVRFNSLLIWLVLMS
jgi:cohesin loading factor subunit SCC2